MSFNKYKVKPAEIWAGLFILLCLAIVVRPALCKSVSDRMTERCQRNLQLIGRALLMYADDNSGTFPVNKSSFTDTSNQRMVPLPANDRALSANYLNYVSSLEFYLPKVGVSNALLTHEKNESSVWRCPAVGNRTIIENAPAGYQPARITYAMNCLITGTSLQNVKDPTMTMAFRESGINHWAELAAYLAYIDYSTKPINIFNPATLSSKPTLQNIHGRGSHVLLVDGHVQWFANSIARDSNITNTFSSNQGKWGLTTDAGKTALLWISP